MVSEISNPFSAPPRFTLHPNPLNLQDNCGRLDTEQQLLEEISSLRESNDFMQRDVSHLRVSNESVQRELSSLRIATDLLREEVLGLSQTVLLILAEVRSSRAST